MIVQMRAVLKRIAVTVLPVRAIPLVRLDKVLNLILTTKRGGVDNCVRAIWNLTSLPLTVLTLLLANSNESH